MRSLRRSQAKTLVACVEGLVRDAYLAAIGRGMRGPIAPKHRIKRVDRFLSNPRLDRDAASLDCIRLVVMGRKVGRVIIDWTEVHDGHQTLVAAIVTGHRRALPMAAETVAKADLTLRQNATELAFLRWVRELFPPSCQPILLADRGFCRVAWLAAAEALGWRYVIWLTGDRWVDPPGYTGLLQNLPARRVRWGDWSRAAIPKARVVTRLIATWGEVQQEPWFLVTNHHQVSTDPVIRA